MHRLHVVGLRSFARGSSQHVPRGGGTIIGDAARSSRAHLQGLDDSRFVAARSVSSSVLCAIKGS